MSTQTSERLSCDQCSLAIIQGTPCHEAGCPNSWIDPKTDEGYTRECPWCGCGFVPKDSNQTFCEDSCAESFYG